MGLAPKMTVFDARNASLSTRNFRRPAAPWPPTVLYHYSSHYPILFVHALDWDEGVDEPDPGSDDEPEQD